ncbi:class I SAM-dependent DNA methyltransferase [Actinomycetospora straminea]|uniref:Class I SAM-dependent methyltransferase n=1 Tax=Actinomycetospora straminea TaxID=663607 RepID=A0ABP9E163_9PSEU|nr:class I SAM-dependent methyltransferase [Actinomycetospora straminea]MDD7931142.1 class I SAM-dependent methyltransferase [Actinomycetospora straminea]
MGRVVGEPPDRAATRAGYDAIAAPYTATFRDELARAPLDRALLAAFAELVGPDADVVDAGSGPGGVTAHLRDLGLRVRGIDLSPGMVALARREHPDLVFDVGDLADLGVLGISDLGGIVAWYSLIHVPPAQLPGVLAGFHRALRPGGHLLLGFQVGDDVVHHDEAFGHRVDLDFRRLRPDAVAALLVEAGFAVTARLVREPVPDSRAPALPQAAILARRPAAGDHQAETPA